MDRPRSRPPLWPMMLSLWRCHRGETAAAAQKAAAATNELEGEEAELVVAMQRRFEEADIRSVNMRYQVTGL